MTHPFYLATTETTTAQFRRFVATQAVAFQTRAERDAGWGLVGGEWVLRPGFSWRDLGELKLLDDHPALNVTGEEAARYCRWRTDAEHLYRLPGELEWEHACRAGTLDPWCFGDEQQRLSQFAWTIEKSGRSPHPVAQLRANAFGLFDMHGNHAEWCRPEDPTAKDWPTRGGGFLSMPEEVTCTSRKLLPPIHLEAGFRVLREIPVDVLNPQTQE